VSLHKFVTKSDIVCLSMFLSVSHFNKTFIVNVRLSTCRLPAILATEIMLLLYIEKFQKSSIKKDGWNKLIVL